LTDGNSVFLTAVEALHRRLAIPVAGMQEGVVVAIGYPMDNPKWLWSSRRDKDLLPPAPDSKPNEGGADEFADFIQQRIKPFVYQRLMETRGAVPGLEALYGHSYGGIFSLHVLFTRPQMFDCLMASSPSIEWHDKFILQEEQSFRSGDEGDGRPQPSLMLFVGTLEQAPRQRRRESDEDFCKRRKFLEDARIVDNVKEMHARLEESKKLRRLSLQMYEEGHVGIIPCAVNHSLMTFLEDWPFEEK
jgi:predicted alpha/beta superfamily hydrolase